MCIFVLKFDILHHCHSIKYHYRKSHDFQWLFLFSAQKTVEDKLFFGNKKITKNKLIFFLAKTPINISFSTAKNHQKLIQGYGIVPLFFVGLPKISPFPLLPDLVMS
jgi:hypothetical protein